MAFNIALHPTSYKLTKYGLIEICTVNSPIAKRIKYEQYKVDKF